jgi:hypothetical protein
MGTRVWFSVVIGAAILTAADSQVHAGNAVLEFRAQDFETHAARDAAGAFRVLRFTVPEAATGSRIDGVLLELHVVVTHRDAVREGTTPVIEVLALSEECRGDEIPASAPASTSAFNVAPGEGRKVTVDITEMVKGWISSPETNHGLAIRFPAALWNGAITIRDDALGGGKAAKVSFVYQNRFGGRIPR